MSETLECVFIPPRLGIGDVSAIILACEAPAGPPPVLQLLVGDATFDLPPPTEAGGCLTWVPAAVCDLAAEFGDASGFALAREGGERVAFELGALVLVAAAGAADPPSGVFLVECGGALLGRAADFGSGPVSFAVKGLPVLEHRAVVSLQEQLGDLAVGRRRFREHQRRLKRAGIDLCRLEDLRAQFEEGMRRKRRLQHALMRQNQVLQAEMTRDRCERDQANAIDGLRRHLEANRQRVTPAGDPAAHRRLVQLRVVALGELRTVFPLVQGEGEGGVTLCGARYWEAPTAVQWGEMRAFLGFATHFVREVSRVAGIPLHYILVPHAGASRAVCRLTDEVRQIPQVIRQETRAAAAAFEVVLVECCRHVAGTLQMSFDASGGLPAHLELLNAISERDLETLVPYESGRAADAGP